MDRNSFPHIVIASGARTPVGAKCGALSDFSPEDLAVCAAEEAISRSGIDRENIDAAIGANVYQFTSPGAQDIYFPRNVGLRCGLPVETPALMVQRICGSGLQTMINAFQQIAMPQVVDDARAVLCFGAETMSRVPQISEASRLSASDFWVFDDTDHHQDMMLSGLNHDLASTAMMLTADEYGSRIGVTRRDCDEFAVLSHERAREANRNSHLNGGDALGGIFALEATNLSGQPVHLARDECVRETCIEELKRLPGFTPHGLVSPGNASEISDGAAATVLADRTRAEELGLPTRFEIAGYGVSGVDPVVMGRGPGPAIQQALLRAGIKQKDVGLFEVNEAFAAQYLGVEREFGLDRELTNVNGGAIAIGHPLAATGGRMIVDLMYEMPRRGAKYGCASACIGGGQGAAIVIVDTEQN